MAVTTKKALSLDWFYDIAITYVVSTIVSQAIKKIYLRSLIGLRWAYPRLMFRLYRNVLFPFSILALVVSNRFPAKLLEGRILILFVSIHRLICA